MQIQLRSSAGELVPGEIVPANAEHLGQIRQTWTSLLNEAQQPDRGWDWEYFIRLAHKESRYEAWAVEAENLVQGMILLETRWHSSQVSVGDRLVYVEAIASAPWNRSLFGYQAHLKGAGSVLMRFSRTRSQEVGCSGRVGLHSLPEAEGFYRAQGMPDYGPDESKDELTYFEHSSLRQPLWTIQPSFRIPVAC